MILSFDQLNPKARTLMRAFLNIRPVPVLQAWENIAQNLVQQGFLTEACYLLDIAASHYDPATIRRLSNRILPVPETMRGRPLTGFVQNHQKPAIYALRDHFRPLRFNTFIGVRSGSNLMIMSPDSGWIKQIHVFTDRPSLCADTSPSDPLDNKCISAISTDNCLVYSDGTDQLHWVDLSSIQNPQSIDPKDISILPHGTLKCPNTIHRLCGPLEDGTFFITYQPEIPVLSDVCVLCQLDCPKIRKHFDGTCTDIQSIGAVKKWTILSNIEQSLNGDICALPQFFMTCRGGMQNREIRFIFSDGSWTTRFIHESPVIKMIETESGPVSLDSSGQAFLWSETSVIGDALFPLELDENYSQDDDTLDFTLDWKNKQLYITQTPSDLPANHKQILNASHAFLLDYQKKVSTESFIKKIYPGSLVIFADGEYYFWNHALNCVEPVWQLSKVLATAEDWHSVLDTPQSPEIESDPRIRIIIPN